MHPILTIVTQLNHSIKSTNEPINSHMKPTKYTVHKLNDLVISEKEDLKESKAKTIWKL